MSHTLASSNFKPTYRPDFLRPIFERHKTPTETYSASDSIPFLTAFVFNPRHVKLLNVDLDHRAIAKVNVDDILTSQQLSGALPYLV